jgi:alkane 1-monooxygenase
MLRSLAYLLVFLVPLSSLLGIHFQGYLFWSSALTGLVFLPIIDTLVGDSVNVRETSPLEVALGRLIIVLYLPFQFFLIGYSCYQAQVSNWPFWIWPIAALSIGVSTGGIGITLAHELVHRTQKSFRVLGGFLLSSVCYGHFMVEHVHGHHTWVATPKDPATAKKNENFYRFFIRSTTHSFFSGLKIENERLAKRKLRFFHNRNFWTWLASFFWFGLAMTLLGPKAAIFFLAQSFIAIVFLEMVNYIEHYGLLRKQLPNGSYEPVAVTHSWDSSRIVSNWVLANLEKHSDHHKYPTRDFVKLRNYPEAPRLPFGYPELVVLCLIPPLWFRVMNPRLESLHRQ